MAENYWRELKFAVIGAGMNPVAYGKTATASARERVTALLSTLGDSVEVWDEQMNWCVVLSGAALRAHLPVLEGMTQAVRGTALLALETDLSFADLKMLTPTQVVDEGRVAQLFHDAAVAAKDKMDALQRKLETLP